MRISKLFVFFVLCNGLASLIHAKKNNVKPKRLFEKIHISPRKVHVVINADLKQKYLKSNFFAEYGPDVDLTKIPRPIALLPAILNLISIIWASGEKYFVAELDAQLYRSLKKIKQVIKEMFPHTSWDGELIPKKLVSHLPKQKSKYADYVALFFSGGLDSITTSFRHADKKQLLISIWGNSDCPYYNQEMWAKVKKNNKKFAADHGHAISFIRSNFFFFINKYYLEHEVSSEIVSWRMDTVEGLGWAGLAAPILYTKGIPLVLIASSISWDFPAKIASNPIIDNTIQCAETRMHQDGFGMDRMEKFKFIRDFCATQNITKPFLKVCASVGDRNCHRCIKCLQTMTEALVAGENYEDYGFHLDEKTLFERMAQKVQSRQYSKRRIWHFWSIQKRLQERLASGEILSPFLAWMANVEIPFTQEIDWRKFMQKFPWYRHKD